MSTEKIPYSADEESSFEKEKVDVKKADNTLAFMDAHAEEFEGVTFTEEEDKQVLRQIYKWLIPLVTIVNTVLFMDKATLSYSSILGLFESTHINSSQYNDTNSLFYTGYLVGQVLNFVLQKIAARKFITINLFIWAVIIFLHCTATNFAGLMALRFFLGFFESVITPAMEVTMFQFMTPQERATANPIFWISCVGWPIVIAGFIAYGVLHITNSIPPWQIFMIINGGITLVITALCAWIYPADPTDAKFLTTKQKYFLIKKIQKATSAAVTQSSVKRHQVVECLRDPISWLFSLMVFLSMLANNLTYQQNLLYVSLGVSRLGSTLVSVAGAAFSSVFMICGAVLVYFWPNHTAWVNLISNIPSIAAGIAMVTIPWEKKLALLAMLVLGAHTYSLGYISTLGWSTSSCAGNTKKFVRHFMFMVAYAISNIVAPQLWTGHHAPRYYSAWIVQIVLAWTGAPLVGFIIHFILKSRNKKRLEYIAAHGKGLGTVVHVNEAGEEVEEDVDIANLDLTDLENKRFIYPL